MRLKAAAIAKAAKTSNTRAKEYSALNANRYQAPPTAIRSKPKPMVLKAPRSYFCGFEARMPPKTSVQQPESTRTKGKISIQSVITFVAYSIIAPTMNMRKTPMESVSCLLSAMALHA